MIALRVYNWELFERSKWRYLAFASIILAIIVLSLFYKTEEKIHGIISAIILLMIVWWYLFFLTKVDTEIQIIIKSEGLQIGDKVIPFASFKGFVLEMEKKKSELKNIVLIFEKTVEIYTLKDSDENQQLFFAELSKVIPFLETYHQWMVDKIMRKLKL